MCTHRGGLSAMTTGGNPTVRANAMIGGGLGASPYENFDPNADYRNNGIPYAFQQELKADGYEMDAPAVLQSVPVGAEVELYDVQANQIATYRKDSRTVVRFGNPSTRIEYTRVDGNIDHFGAGPLTGHRVGNGIVAKVLRLPRSRNS